MSAAKTSPNPPAAGSWLKWRHVAAVGAVGLLVAGAILAREYVSLPGGQKRPDPTPPDRPGASRWDADAVELMRAQLKQWGEPTDAKDGPKVARAYLSALSFDAPEEEATSPHPDAVFARRFPKPSAEPKELTPAALEAWLHKLLADHLKAERVPEKGLVPHLKAVADATAYLPWFENWAPANLRGPEGKDALVFALDKPAAKSAAFARRFVARPDAAPDEVRDAARLLVKQLNEWKVKGVAEADADARPGYVARAYFHFLSRGHFGEKALDGKDWHGAFLKRLPAKPAGADQDVGTEKGLKAALLQLLLALKSPDLQADYLTLGRPVALVGEALDYKKWVDAAREDDANPEYKGYVPNPSLLPEGTVQFAERFRVGK